MIDEQDALELVFPTLPPIPKHMTLLSHGLRGHLWHAIYFSPQATYFYPLNSSCLQKSIFQKSNLFIYFIIIIIIIILSFQDRNFSFFIEFQVTKNPILINILLTFSIWHALSQILFDFKIIFNCFTFLSMNKIM